MEELISVIVPVYNCAKYVEACLESVTNQTYRKLDIIVIDDGSTDESGSICDRIARDDSRIRVFHQLNRGLSAARNKGLENARGEYILFVDSDDTVFTSDTIRKLYDKLKRDKSQMAMGGYCHVDESGEELSAENLPDDIWDAEKFLSYYSQNKSNSCIYVWTKLYSKSIFQDLRFPEGKYYEDEWIIDSVIEKCNRISTLDVPVIRYLERAGSIVNCDNMMLRVHRAEGLVGRIERCIRKKEYRFVKEWFLEGTIDVLRGYVSTDYKANPKTREYIHSIRKRYSSCSKSILMHTKIDSAWIKIMLWNLGLHLYRRLRNLSSDYPI